MSPRRVPSREEGRQAAERTRAALAREIEGSQVPVAAGHFPGLVFGRLVAGEGKPQRVV